MQFAMNGEAIEVNAGRRKLIPISAQHDSKASLEVRFLAYQSTKRAAVRGSLGRRGLRAGRAETALARSSRE